MTSSSNQRQAFVLSAGTDGRIALWDISSLIIKFCESLPTWSTRAHKKWTDSDSLDNISFKGVETIKSQPVVLDSHDLQPKHVYTAHQSGVNSMDVRKMGEKLEKNIGHFVKFNWWFFCKFIRDTRLIETLVNLFFNPGDDQYLIASGGDDNSINVVFVRCFNRQHFEPAIVCFCTCCSNHR